MRRETADAASGSQPSFERLRRLLIRGDCPLTLVSHSVAFLRVRPPIAEFFTLPDLLCESIQADAVGYRSAFCSAFDSTGSADATARSKCSSVACRYLRLHHVNQAKSSEMWYCGGIESCRLRRREFSMRRKLLKINE